MSNVLNEEKKQQVIALGKLGWPLRRIEQATGVRRETASAYLKAAGIVVRLPRFWGKRIPAKPANEVTPDFIAPFSQKIGDPHAASPASPSICEAYRELIEQGLARGRNGKAIWQDLVSDHGFAGDYQAVKRFVRKLRGPQHPEAAGIILTAPGEEAQVDYGSGPMVRDPKTGKYHDCLF
jgi:transposase